MAGIDQNVHGLISLPLSNLPESVLPELPSKFNFPSRFYYKREDNNNSNDGCLILNSY